jgi:gamma-glutamyl-gamma-aminobutyrate hydrolase PuuD
MNKKPIASGGEDPGRKVYLMEEGIIEYPELWMEIFIAGDIYEQRAFAQMMVQAACSKAESPDKADLVVFTGGADVNPALYGKKPHKDTHWNDDRDKDDIELWEYCVANGIPMLGVCRGAQFGHVMKGGSLYQDVDNHYGDHQIWDTDKQRDIGKVSSVHHQTIIPDQNLGIKILADCYHSTENWYDDKSKRISPNALCDVEAFFYRDVAFIGVQGHPEYKGYSRYTKYVLELINQYVLENPDIELSVEGSVRRIKEDRRTTSEISKTLKELV